MEFRISSPQQISTRMIIVSAHAPTLPALASPHYSEQRRLLRRWLRRRQRLTMLRENISSHSPPRVPSPLACPASNAMLKSLQSTVIAARRFAAVSSLRCLFRHLACCTLGLSPSALGWSTGRRAPHNKHPPTPYMLHVRIACRVSSGVLFPHLPVQRTSIGGLVFGASRAFAGVFGRHRH